MVDRSFKHGAQITKKTEEHVWVERRFLPGGRHRWLTVAFEPGTCTISIHRWVDRELIGGSAVRGGRRLLDVALEHRTCALSACKSAMLFFLGRPEVLPAGRFHARGKDRCVDWRFCAREKNIGGGKAAFKHRPGTTPKAGIKPGTCAISGYRSEVLSGERHHWLDVAFEHRSRALSTYESRSHLGPPEVLRPGERPLH